MRWQLGLSRHVQNNQSYARVVRNKWMLVETEQRLYTILYLKMITDYGTSLLYSSSYSSFHESPIKLQVIVDFVHAIVAWLEQIYYQVPNEITRSIVQMVPVNKLNPYLFILLIISTNNLLLHTTTLIQSPLTFVINKLQYTILIAHQSSNWCSH